MSERPSGTLAELGTPGKPEHRNGTARECPFCALSVGKMTPTHIVKMCGRIHERCVSVFDADENRWIGYDERGLIASYPE